MSVTVSGLSGLTNAYTSVLSATGSLEISGASRCDDIYLPHWLETGSRRARTGPKLSRNWLEWADDSGWQRVAASADGPGDPGGQVLVPHPGLAGPGEHLDVPRSGIAYVLHDRPGGRLGRAVALRLRRCRRTVGGGQGRAGGRT